MGYAKVSLPSEREIAIVRDFRAPKSLVFETWTNREHLRRWYGLRHFAMADCEIDFREGGKWRWVLRDLEVGVDHAISGEYRVIEPPDRLVFTERYEAVPGSNHIVILMFQKQGSGTSLSMHLLYQSAEHRDGQLQSGMERLMHEALNRLEELLDSMMEQSA